MALRWDACLTWFSLGLQITILASIDCSCFRVLELEQGGFLCRGFRLRAAEIARTRHARAPA